MCDTFISMFRDIDLLYGFIHECAYLINNLYEHNNYDHLVEKLCDKFVLILLKINIKKNIIHMLKTLKMLIVFVYI